MTVFRFHSPNENVPSPSDFDMVGIGYPIHAFNVPKAFYKFIRKLPPQKDKKYFIWVKIRNNSQEVFRAKFIVVSLPNERIV